MRLEARHATGSAAPRMDHDAAETWPGPPWAHPLGHPQATVMDGPPAGRLPPMAALTWTDPPANLSTLRLGMLVFDLAGRDVNVLDEAVLAELEQRAGEVTARRLEAVVLVSGKRSGFCAGADVDLISS